jgi:hypothetical protein
MSEVGFEEHGRRLSHPCPEAKPGIGSDSRLSGEPHKESKAGWLVLLAPLACCGGPFLVAAVAAAGAAAWGGIGAFLLAIVLVAAVITYRRRRVCCTLEGSLDARLGANRTAPGAGTGAGSWS